MIRKISTQSSQPSLTNTINPLVTKWAESIHRFSIHLLISIFIQTLKSDEPLGNIAYLYAFTAIGIFIMLLACINYMNLSTAKSAKRATEIAMKKTLGSSRTSLIFSFLGESIFLSLMSLVVAIVLVQIVVNLSSFNALIGRNLGADFLHNPGLLFGSIAIALSIGLLSGLYPAFLLPSIPTIMALKGSFKNRQSGSHAEESFNNHAIRYLNFCGSVYAVHAGSDRIYAQSGSRF